MTIDDVITAMYESMCFERGGRPDWERQAKLFAPQARLVRVNDEGVFEFDPGSFRDDLEGKISSGSIASFWEGELQRDAQEFGDIAHVLSLYETRSSRGAEPGSRALKSIQLFKRSGRWWISAMIWRREGGDFGSILVMCPALSSRGVIKLLGLPFFTLALRCVPRVSCLKGIVAREDSLWNAWSIF